MKLQNNMSAISGGMTNGAVTTAGSIALTALATSYVAPKWVKSAALVTASAAAACAYFHNDMVSADAIVIENGTIAGVAGMEYACVASSWTQDTAIAGYNWVAAKYSELRA